MSHPAIAALDAALAADGQDILLRRVVGTTNQAFVDVPCRAAVRSPSAQQLLAGFTQADSFVILSPTEINRAQWPGAQPPGVAGDVRVPSKNRGDKCRIAGTFRAIEQANPFYVGGELVRIELRVLG